MRFSENQQVPSLFLALTILALLGVGGRGLAWEPRDRNLDSARSLSSSSRLCPMCGNILLLAVVPLIARLEEGEPEERLTAAGEVPYLAHPFVTVLSKYNYINLVQ